MGALGRFLRSVTLWDIWKGLALTMRHALRKPVTLRYPEQRREVAERFRGRHRLRRWDDGSERCVACGMCAAVCPAAAIYIEPGETQYGERFAKVYEVNAMRCVYCGFCVEACPYDAIVMTGDYEMAEYNKADLLWDKDRLTEPDPAARAQES
ncbi:MAG: NADH-quinone oxidoreductase subunit NuoI [Candidatus Alcyoniella australis]|nr:NADH-quinone oxidoreductase subunit NuoI [Candidatus Alcyoniella australis]